MRRAVVLFAAMGCRPSAPQPEHPSLRAPAAAESTKAIARVESRRGCGGGCTGWTQHSLPWHESAIAAIATSGDGLVSASLSFDGTLRTWVGPTLRPHHVLAIGPHPGDRLVLTADGHRLGHGSGATITWLDPIGDPRTPERLELSAPIVDVVAVPGADTFAIALADGTVRIASMSAVLQTIDLRSPVLCLAVSHDGSSVAVSHGTDKLGELLEFGAVERFAIATGESLAAMTPYAPGEAESRSAYITPQYALAFSHDDQLLAGGGYGIEVWDSATGLVVHERPWEDGHAFEGAALQLHFEPGDGAVVYVADLGTVVRWRLGAPSLDASFASHGARHLDAFASGTRAIAAADNGSLAVLDLATGEALATVEGPPDGVTALSFGPDARQLVGGLGDGRMLVWDLADGGTPRTLQRHRSEVTDLVYEPASGILYSGGHDGAVIAWSPQNWTPSAELSTDGVPVFALGHCAAHELLLAARADGTVDRYDMRTGQALGSWHAHDKEVTGVDCSADGQTIATVSEDGVGKLWSPEGTLLHTLRADAGPRAFQAVIFVDDATLVTGEAFLGDDALRWWSAADGRALPTVAPLEYGVTALALRAGSPQIAGADLGNGGASLWDVAGGDPVAVFPGSGGNAMSLAVSPDGDAIAIGTTGNEQAIRVWTRD